MKRTLIRRIIECLVMLAISAALWQLTLIPIASTINKKAPLTLPQNVFVIAAFSVLVILINLYAKKQSYINWKEFFFRKCNHKMDTVRLACYSCTSLFSNICRKNRRGTVFRPKCKHRGSVPSNRIYEDLYFKSCY